MRRHIERIGDAFREGAPEFDPLHKGFHTALLAACGSTRLLAAHSDLYDQAYRYRRVMMRSFDDGERVRRRASEARRSRSSRATLEAAQTMLAQHLHSTLDFVYPPDQGS